MLNLSLELLLSYFFRGSLVKCELMLPDSYTWLKTCDSFLYVRISPDGLPAILPKCMGMPQFLGCAPFMSSVLKYLIDC
jgi:hypothetical protein